MGEAAPEGTERWLVLALAADEDPGTRANLVEALGRIASQTSMPILGRALSSGDSEVKVGACRGIAEAGRRGRVLAGEGLATLLSVVDSEGGSDLVSACVEALGRLPAGNERREAIGQALTRAVASDSP